MYNRGGEATLTLNQTSTFLLHRAKTSVGYVAGQRGQNSLVEIKEVVQRTLAIHKIE